MKITTREIRQAYYGFKDLAARSLKVQDADEALRYIDSCAVLAQQFNWIYSDDDLESLEKQTGEFLLPKHVEDYNTYSERIVFFDDFCVTYVLAVQYLDALSAMGKKVLYITSNKQKNKVNTLFFDRISQIPNLEILKVKTDSYSEEILSIYHRVMEFHPSKILLHINANSKIVPALYVLPAQIEKYLINLADQTFWLGAKAIDYCIEFRPFGAAISVDRRGLKFDQLLMLPFYPIQDKNPFEGFPKETEGHLTIFSGGEVYKTLDSKRTYWKLIKWILDSYPDVRFLFAAKGTRLGDAFIKDFVRTNHFENRFLQIGFRKDIYEVLRHCDIYMGTSPTSGSLMSQLAAINSKPILQYYYPGTPDDETEQALCINDTFPISFQDEEAFKHEASRLIADAVYRKQQGERIQKAMIQPAQFNEALKHLVDTNESPFPVVSRAVDHRLIEERWYALEKNGYLNTFNYVCGLLGKKDLFRYVPSLYLKKQSVIIRNKCCSILNKFGLCHIDF